MAMTVVTVASLSKLFSEAIESIDEGPIEAAVATGANRLQAISYAVLPQIIPPFHRFCHLSLGYQRADFHDYWLCGWRWHRLTTSNVDQSARLQ